MAVSMVAWCDGVGVAVNGELMMCVGGSGDCSEGAIWLLVL